MTALTLCQLKKVHLSRMNGCWGHTQIYTNINTHAANTEGVKSERDQCGTNRPQWQWSRFWAHLGNADYTELVIDYQQTSSDISRDIGWFSENQEVKSRRLVLCDKTSRACSVHLTDLRLSRLRMKPLTHPLGEELCHFLRCQRDDQHTFGKALYWAVWYVSIVFSSSDLKPQHQVPTPPLCLTLFCLIISRHTCTEDGNLLFHLLLQTNVPSSSAHSSNFPQHPLGRMYLCWDW